MLENVAKITRVVLACGTVDLRKGIDGLSVIIGDKYLSLIHISGPRDMRRSRMPSSA